MNEEVRVTTRVWSVGVPESDGEERDKNEGRPGKGIIGVVI